METININTDIIIKNIYTFTLIDENDNIIDTKKVTNVAMGKKYLLYGATNLSLELGTMLESDKKKYIDSNGYWLKGYAAHRAEGGGRETNEEIRASADDDSWYFYREPTVDDTGLFGSRVASFSLKWESEGLNVNKRTTSFKAAVTWGYHNPAQLGNIDYKIEDAAVNKKEAIKNGINIVDGCLVFGTTIFSHFVVDFFKRPFEKLNIKVQAVFSNIPQFKKVFQEFTPYSNLMWGNSTGAYNKTCDLLPQTVALSGLPIKNCSLGGIVPVFQYYDEISLNTVATDKPKTWEQKNGEWNGFPFYKYFGSGSYYKKEKAKDKDGEEYEVYSLNEKNQKIFDWENFQSKNIQGYGLSRGPIRSIVIPGKAAAEYSNVKFNSEETIITYIFLGKGNGKMTKFYFPFTTETGVVVDAHCLGEDDIHVTRIVPYNPNSNPLKGQKFVAKKKITDNEILFSSDDKNSITSSDSSNIGYNLKTKSCPFSFHPFDLDYYSIDHVVGSDEWIIYPEFNGTIGSGWIGFNNGARYTFGWSSDLSIKTGATYMELSNSRTWTIPSDSTQHEGTWFYKIENGEKIFDPIVSKGMLAVKGSSGWNYSPNCYVGGMTFSNYDRAAIRISSSAEVGGFVEFDRAPGKGSSIYIDVKLLVPFIGDFTSLKGKYVLKIGDEENNGNPKKEE